jgi:hypothetical protein
MERPFFGEILATAIVTAAVVISTRRRCSVSAIASDSERDTCGAEQEQPQQQP